MGSLSHVEIYVSNLGQTVDFWGWLLPKLGFEPFQEWESGKSWRSGFLTEELRGRGVRILYEDRRSDESIVPYNNGMKTRGRMLEVRRLVSADFDQYFALRLAGLIECPAAYATDADAWRSSSKETIERHLQASQDEHGLLILGAWMDDEIVGLLGLSREERRSVSHKAGLWGFYVSPPYRRQGIGRTLLTDVIAHARAMPDLRQLRAVVSTSSPEALSLFEELGFQRFGLEPDARQVNGRFHDQVYLWYSLHDER